MRDVNYTLRKAYKNALDATGIPAYYMSAPDSALNDEYIIFRGLESTEESTKNSVDTGTSVTVEIHSFVDKSNSGRGVEQIADDIFRYVYALPQFILDLENMQMVQTKMQSDRTNNYGWLGSRMYIDRVITFKHNIFIGGTRGMIYNGIGRYTYTATGGETSFTVSAAVGMDAVAMFKDGILYTQTTGTPTGKKYTFNSSTGVVSFEIECEPGEILFFLYE